MAHEDMFSHFVPIWSVRVSGFDVQQSCGTMANMSSLQLALQAILHENVQSQKMT